MVQPAAAKAPDNVVPANKSRDTQPLMTDESLGAAAMGGGPNTLYVSESVSLESSDADDRCHITSTMPGMADRGTNGVSGA